MWPIFLELTCYLLTKTFQFLKLIYNILQSPNSYNEFIIHLAHKQESQLSFLIMVVIAILAIVIMPITMVIIIAPFNQIYFSFYMIYISI